MNSLVLPPGGTSHVRALHILVTNKHRLFQYRKNTLAIKKATGSSYRHYYLNNSDFRVTF